MQLHERSEALRTQIGSLEALSAGYNGVRRTMLPIEQPLLQTTLNAVDTEFQSGLLVRSGCSCCCHHNTHTLSCTCLHATHLLWGLTDHRNWQVRRKWLLDTRPP